MLDTTRTAIKSVAACDPSITPELLAAGLDAMAGDTAAPFTDNTPLDVALSRRQCAEILHVSTRTVTAYAAQGLIRPFRFGAQSKRSTGYSRQSVRELMERNRKEGTPNAN